MDFEAAVAQAVDDVSHGDRPTECRLVLSQRRAEAEAAMRPPLGDAAVAGPEPSPKNAVGGSRRTGLAPLVQAPEPPITGALLTSG